MKHSILYLIKKQNLIMVNNILNCKSYITINDLNFRSAIRLRVQSVALCSTFRSTVVTSCLIFSFDSNNICP